MSLEKIFKVRRRGNGVKARESELTRAMQYSLGFSFSRPYFSRASTTAKSAVSLVERRMVLYGMLGFRLSAYILKVPPAVRRARYFMNECIS